MNRTIEFRGLRTDGKGWVYGYLLVVGDVYFIVPTDTKMVKIYGKRHIHWDDLIEVNPDTIGQFTGLRDKNGVKIFEGDIVESHAAFKGQSTYIREVVWGNCGLEFKPQSGFILCQANEHHFEIIGNIHETLS